MKVRVMNGRLSAGGSLHQDETHGGASSRTRARNDLLKSARHSRADTGHRAGFCRDLAGFETQGSMFEARRFIYRRGAGG
jgi:hypothetical protein